MQNYVSASFTVPAILEPSLNVSGRKSSPERPESAPSNYRASTNTERVRLDPPKSLPMMTSLKAEKRPTVCQEDVAE